jgi:phytoene/squalene synthetase
MCLRVFVEGDEKMYEELKSPAMNLGSAFQKVNFLRDLKADIQGLGRSYFPANLKKFRRDDKQAIEKSIQEEFDSALAGIKQLPTCARLGVYTAYVYYLHLFRKIKKSSPTKIMSERIRISNPQKIYLLLKSVLELNLKLI